VGAGQHGLLLVRNPGVNLLAGEIPETIPSAWPPTLLAQQVTSGNNGISVEGYRNYVGQWVVGAWRWMPDHEIGLALEEHADDAFASVAQIKRAIGGLTALFVLSTAGVSMFSLVKLSRSRMRELSDVGAYQVQELLGEGGMGRVYLAEHALLCRQSAVKVLNGNVVDHSVISRFEREVQLASQLTHPNTIAIYDFGRNKEGLFYYAMEYINGAHLGQLVEYSGPLHPGRCIYVLRQLCRALGEAHQVGVVHRDIKPQNIMVCNRGGEPDFVKLFDYGLVKAFAPGVSPTFSQTKIVVGTPRFMAPERLSSPWLADPRVDIYSVGALAYFLLTSKLPPLFTSIGSGASDQPGVETLDLPAGVVEFGELLGMCLSTEPADRPSSMKALLDALELLAERFPWSREDSVVWWSKHEAKLLQLVKSKRKKLVAQLAR
jgi:serine/threonine protein kinase